ncbi:MAG: hypothetical protein EAZ70_11095 [Runella slithyformis]|nr:MAG: hypothetical protein EAY79_11825 [Runella slithyformis]TAF95564.1 MAG: hypothetical protein EAZ46_07475 [Runella sp.]TAG18859.1 MAG: hypothetical protein EAZ38_13775 [Cytophagales bacterium]TAG41180.1 MAG: hypothetical protein EAZ32_04210 [Cytophagia bacterium]TAF01184.1 MAG: hypothetical protein EAZ80_02975 [Runella slithyformis]
MLFVIHAYDYTDPQALDRRMAARPDHLQGAQELKTAGHFVVGGALLSPDNQMIGSMMLVEFEDEAQMRQWLDNDPYVTGKVWEKINVNPFRKANV